jgi:outer membrane protein assembly factor BamB
MVRRPFAAVVMVLVVLTATGCLQDWSQFSVDTANTRSSADDGLSTSKLPTLAADFTATTGGVIYSSPVVASKVAYVTSDDGKLDAYDATGASCPNNPRTCTALWTANIEPAGALGSSATISSTPAVAKGVVYVGSTTGALEAFDATGTTNCSGSPKVCTPLWTASTGGAIFSSPVVSGSTVLIGSTDKKLYAFDAAGSTNCSGSPKVCTPLWTATTGGAISDTAAVSNGVAYIGSADSKLYAFDAAGSTNCAGSPTVCSPLWTGTAGPITFSSPSVSNGSVFVGSTNNKLFVFDAAGSTNCAGSPTVCTPLWTATTGGAIVSSPAVSSNTLFVGSSDHKLYAFDATGTSPCSGSPKVCTPKWTATTGGVVRSSPAVAGKMVFVGSDDHTVAAYDAAGTTNCAGSPVSCTPLFSTSTGAAVASSPIVAQGTLYFGSLDHKLYALQPWTFRRPNCIANNQTTMPGLNPCQIQDAYELPSAVTGAGRTVAIVDAMDDPKAETDLGVYRAQFNLPPCTTANGCFKKLNQSGQPGPYPASDAGWAEEISLDVDAVSAGCPLCHITLVEASSAMLSDLATAEAAAAATHPTVISNSWGAPEFSSETGADTLFSFSGIPVTFSTGDAGFAGGTTWPASDPLVTAVGGTELAPDSSARGWSETVWDLANSGCSQFETAKPAFQTDTGCANRTIADVSALAGSPGLSIFDSFAPDTGWEDFGGTSLASPLIASTYALAAPDSPTSFTYSHASSLFDVTSGSNGSCGGTYLCTGAVGYDGPSGLGTPCGTAAFGTGPFTTTCPPTSAAAPAAQPFAAQPKVVFTPVCPSPPPGSASCFAKKIEH